MVTIFSKTGCVQCMMTKKFLDQLHVGYKEINISLTQNKAELDRLRSENKKQLPVIETGTESWSGFVPAKLRTLATS